VAGRITRKELKTDKFAVEVEHTVDFVTQHRRELTIYGSIAAAVVVISIGIYFFARHQHAAREEVLAEAIQIQEAPVGPPNAGALIAFPTEVAKRAAAAKAFGDIVAKYPGSAEAAVSQYYLGATSADQGNLAEAAKRFQAAADAGDSNYASLARLSLAQVDFSQGRVADGEKILRHLMDHPTIFVSKDEATIALAKGIGPTKPAEARKLLEPLRAQGRAVSQAAIIALSELPGQ
jgi:predicted negative regulator of RcsB-dependent stress response